MHTFTFCVDIDNILAQDLHITIYCFDLHSPKIDHHYTYMNTIIYNNVWNTLLSALFLSFVVKPLWDLEKKQVYFFNW